MNYNIEDAKKATKYLESGMAPSTVAIILSQTSERQYTADDICSIAKQLKENPPPSENGRLYDVAAGIVFNRSKRKRIGKVVLYVLIAFVIGMLLLGFFVSWIPVLVIVGLLIGIVLITIIAFIIMLKTGYLERRIEKYNT